MNSDKNLIKTIHVEQVEEYTISAMLTRFGDLAVFVYGEDFVVIFQTDNVLKAREFIARINK